MTGLGSFSGGGLGFGVTFLLRDGFSAVADRIQSRFTQMEANVSAQADRINESFGKIQAGVTMIGTGIGLLAPIMKGVNIAGEFESAELRLETLTKSADKAREIFSRIKKDAQETPFGTQELLAGVTALMATGMAAEGARKDILNLANAVAGSGGGSAELERMAINMQQIKNLGKASALDIRQFAMAGIPIYNLLAESMGKTVDEVKEMDITYEALTKALEHAAAEGGMFEGGLERMATTWAGVMNALEDGIKFTMAAIGNVVLPFLKQVAGYISSFLEWFQKFSETAFGKMAVKIVVAITALIALGVILVGLKMLFVALGGAIWTALAPLLPIIAAIVIVIAYVAALYKLLNSGKPILFAFGAALMFAFGSFGILVGAIIIVIRAIREFNNWFSDTEKMLSEPPPTGLLGFLIRMGALIKAVASMFSNLGGTTWEVSEEMRAALQKLGLWDTAVAIWTWVVRIKQFIVGILDGLKEAWEGVKAAFNAIADAFEPVQNIFDQMTGGVNKNLSALEKWRKYGKYVGYALAVILGVVALVLIEIAIVAVITGAAMFLAFLVPLVVIGLVIAALWLLYEGIMWVVDGVVWLWEQVVQGWEWAKGKLQEFTDWLFGLPQAAYDAGVGFVQSLWDGIKSMWGGFKDWMVNAIGDIPVLGDVMQFGLDTVDTVGGWLGFGEDDDGTNSPDGTTVMGGNITPNTDGGYSSLGDQYSQNKAAMYNQSPVVLNNQTQTVGTVIVQNQLDGEIISEKVVDRVNEKQRFEDSRQ